MRRRDRIAGGVHVNLYRLALERRVLVVRRRGAAGAVDAEHDASAAQVHGRPIRTHALRHQRKVGGGPIFHVDGLRTGGRRAEAQVAPLTNATISPVALDATPEPEPRPAKGWPGRAPQ